jgi:hypothetical protein
MLTRNLSITQGWSQVDLSESSDPKEALAKYIEETDQRFRDILNWLERLAVPEYTTTERNSIDSPENGQMIYNSTTSRFEIRQAGVWKYLTLTNV